MAYNSDGTGNDFDRGLHPDTLWDDIILPPDRLGQGSSSPDRVTLIDDIQAFGFNGAVTMEQLFGSFEIPHDYKEGSTLRPHIHWAPSNANLGDVKWNISYSLKNRYGVYNSSNVISSISSANGIENEHIIEEFDLIEDPTLLIGATCQFRLYRDPSVVEDDYNSDALLLSLGIHYEVDGDGSKQVMSKE